MSDNSRPTMQDIADRTGYCRSTVSLALRNHPSLPKNTRNRILRTAQEIGYQANPLVAALMTHIRNRKRNYSETLAVISRADSQLNVPFYNILHRSMNEAASRLGFKIDWFYAEQENLSGQRLSKILISRGVHGIILFPGVVNHLDYQEMKWEHFVSVLLGFDRNCTQFHNIAADYTYDIDLALQVATRAGCDHVGFAIPEHRDHSTNHDWSSRFLYYQHSRPRSKRVPFPPSADGQLECDSFLAWARKHRPDVLLVAGDTPLHWLRKSGWKIPGDIRMINLVQRGEKGLAGIDPRTATVGRVSIEFLVSLLQNNQFGLPKFPQRISVKGEWRSGQSFPETAQGSSGGRKARIPSVVVL